MEQKQPLDKCFSCHRSRHQQRQNARHSIGAAQIRHNFHRVICKQLKVLQYINHIRIIMRKHQYIIQNSLFSSHSETKLTQGKARIKPMVTSQRRCADSDGSVDTTFSHNAEGASPAATHAGTNAASTVAPTARLYSSSCSEDDSLTTARTCPD